MSSGEHISTDSETALGITRRGFVKLGGALFVSCAIPQISFGKTAEGSTSMDPTALASWLEIRSDNTIIARTGRAETGTGMSGYYAQAIAEELNVRPESISLIMGDTDKTPDGGYSAGFLSGMNNVRKVAAYTYQALVGLAAAKLGVPASALAVNDGVVTGGGKSISYGEMVAGQHLELKIPLSGKLPKANPEEFVGVAGLDGLTVTGDPPMKSASQFKVMGKSYPVPGIPDKVTGKAHWSYDVTLPGMLHARMVRPKALGSTLISVGELDKKQFPTTQIVKQRNLVAVLSPNEWEAIGAAQSVAAGTKWSQWSGLPGSENLTQTLRNFKWGTTPNKRGNAEAVTALASPAKTCEASYEQGYTRHAPIGPFVATADFGSDGVVTVWTHSAQSQGLRARIAYMLGVPAEKVVVRWLEGSGQYGRTTFGGDGAEADAVILSQLTGRPVRVQWTLEEDFTWSSVAPGWISDIKVACDDNGQITALHSTFYAPHMFDPRMVGALLAGLPCNASKNVGGWVATEWPYDKIQNRFEEAYGMPNLGADSVSAGLRGNIMRTPGQRQQNFVLEAMMNETAAAVGADPVEFRIRHTSDQRVIDILRATAKASNWERRPSPKTGARRSGKAPLTGRGVCIIVREKAYWAGVAEISVIPETGAVQVTKFTIGIDPGKVINPRQLDRCMKSGVVMGLSEALKEEVTFDKQTVTSTDWTSYNILTMAETPEIQVVQISRDDKEFGGGSEAANAVCPPAVAAAFFDATGVAPRRLPLTPAYVKELLKG